MVGIFEKSLAIRSTPRMIAIGLGLLTVIALLDLATGFELSFSIFYLIPVAIATWSTGLRMGQFFCVLAAAVWLFIDLYAGYPYSSALIPAWNALVRLGFFLLTAFLLASIKDLLAAEANLARTDALTQTLNARAFKEVILNHLQLARRYRHPLALGYIDLDNFKTVNDTVGHAEGDRVLKAVAERLQANVRKTDAVCRLGGDEFAVFMPETGLKAARAAFEKIHQDLSLAATEQGWSIGFSIGVAVFPDFPCSVDEALQIADKLMYQVKKAGKGALVCQTHRVSAAAAIPARPLQR